MPTMETASLPHAPGVYIFFNHSQEVIYVGKAKNIKRRVKSYFNTQAPSNRKLQRLVSKIDHVQYTITHSERDALLLENNLIKKHQPRYNILLKDDKTYPYICITKEPFPRVISTRKYIAKQGEYFGPYTSVAALNSTLNLLRSIYSIRTCRLALSKKNIENKKFKACLEYHIGNCKAPCVGLQSEEEYNQDMLAARNILRGHFAIVIQHLTERMNHASSNLKFERAARYKDQKDLLERFQAESRVVSKNIIAVDVITITSLPMRAFVNYMQIREGSIILSNNIEIVKKIDETNGYILNHVLHRIKEKYEGMSTTLLSNEPVATQLEGLKNVVPQIGEKKKLVAVSLKNAFFQQRLWQAEKHDKKPAHQRTITILQQALALEHPPHNIECFDISNFHDASPVASMVSFVDGKPKKSNYHRYTIKTTEAPNDFAAMYEVVKRRYTRLIEEHKALPDLIIIDGGKGQLSSAYKALNELGLSNKISIISIAKKLEEIYQPHDAIPLHIDKRSAGLLLIQRIRNEAHRFAVTFHRLKRSKKALAVEAKALAGVGEKTTEKLLTVFKSWKKVKKATPQQLEKVIGMHKAAIIVKAFTEESQSHHGS